MPVREVTAVGLEALQLATQLLQRARRAHPRAGVWEAADVQWSWRAPRESDDVEKLFWVDDHGPVAGVLLTSSASSWQCDPIIVPEAAAPDPGVVWNHAVEHAAAHATGRVDVTVDDSDPVFTRFAHEARLVAGDQDGSGWMAAADRPTVPALRDGFVLVDRSQTQGKPHHLRHRNSDSVAERLTQCSLYDPTLDLAVETTDGRLAGYSLYWFDPVTKVGMVEPVRVEDEFQRRGLARAMVAAGLDRLAAKGATELKVAYETEAAAALYRTLGFQPTSSATWYRVPEK